MICGDEYEKREISANKLLREYSKVYSSTLWNPQSLLNIERIYLI